MTHPDQTPVPVPYTPKVIMSGDGTFTEVDIPPQLRPTAPATIPLEPGENWSTHLPVNEVFGPVIQGEGPYTGRQASFIRLGGQGPGKGCNLHCDPCDTKQTWDDTAYDLKAENPMRFVDKIVHQVGRYNTPLKVISGGEPLLHQQRLAWERLLRGLTGLMGGRDMSTWQGIHVETNGTIPPNDISRFLVRHYSVSPKLRSMGAADPEAKRIKPAALEAFRDLADQGRACLKVVCSTEADVEEAATFADAHGWRREHLWIMPEGDTNEKACLTAAAIGQTAVRMGTNFSPRLHLMMGVR